MSELTAEQLAQKIHDCRLLETKEIDQALSRAGGRGAASYTDFTRVLLGEELLTNWQIRRLEEGHRRGYFYGNWKVLYLVGAGTFARVYRSVNRKTQENKAVKVLRSRYSNDHDTQERFVSEARMVMKLRHPNIVPIHEVDVDRGRSYMVMDFVEGQNLRDYVKAHGSLKPHIVLNIIRDLAAGLAYAAERGITHRDMKLSNVLLSSKGQAKLVDFGLATVSKEFEDEGEGSVFNPRSIDYAGLEKNTNAKRNDPRSDIYFLGCMLYHMACGVPPLLETRERIKRLSSRRYKDIEPMTNHNPNLPHRLVILCNQLMELSPEKRIQTPAIALKQTEIVLNAVETGNAERYDEELSKQHAEEYARLIQVQEEGQGFTVMLVESSVKLQDVLREKLKALGYRVLVMRDPARALDRFRDLDPAEDQPAHCVVFGCAELGRSALDAFNEFGEMEYTSKIPAILFVTERQQAFLKAAKLAEHRGHLELPLKFKRVRRLLRKLLEIPDPPPAEEGPEAKA